jgi:hypothetical protein
MKNIYFYLTLLVMLFVSQTGDAQISITQLIYPRFSTDTTTGGRLPYVFRAKISGLTANTLYRYYTRAASITIDGANGGGGASVFIKPTGNFGYSTNPNFFVAGGADTMRTNALGEVSNWFAFEPTRDASARFVEGNYIHARVYFQPAAGGVTRVVTVTDSIRNIKIDVNTNNATGIYSTSMAPAQDLVFLYDNTAGTGSPLSGTWIESDGLNFKTGTGAGGTPNAASYPDYYKNNVDGVTSAWGTFIPNQLSTGMLRVERRKLSDGTIGWANTDANGIWDVGSVNTINASGGLNALNISTDDAPLVNVPPKIYFINATQTVIENVGTVTISVGLKFPNANPTSVDVLISGGSATTGSDYTYTTQTVTFPANSITPQTVTVNIINDAIAEPLENIIFGLTNFTNSSTAGAPASDTLTIIDDDAPYISFNSSSASGLENITSVNIPVSIMFPGVTATSVNIAVTGGTATLGSDYTFSNQTITFPANSSSPINVPLTIINDTITESNETIIFTLSSATNGAVLGTSVFTYTIIDDDIVPVLTFVRPTYQQIKENVGMVNVRVKLTNPALTATSITVSAFGGNATLGSDYTLPSNTLTFPANTSSVLNYSFPIVDDTLVEGLENIILRLTNANHTVSFNYEYDTVAIVDNDLPVYTISQINKNDGLGVADSSTVLCELHGTVYGPNVRPTGYQFFMNDGTGGIQVLRAFGNFGGYIPQDKDSIVVKGEIQQTNGQLQITNLDTLYKVGTGTYITPTVITSYSEANEGNYVTLQYCHLLNPAQWPTGAGNATVTIVDQNNQLYQTQIYRQTNIDSTPATPYWFNITGFLAQNDATIPWDSNYYLIPLSLQNYEYVYPKMSFTNVTDTAIESIGLDSVEVNLQWAPRTVTTATVAFTGGSATYGQDFNFTTATVTYPGGFVLNAKQKIGVIIIDDALPESYENILLSILGPTNNAIAVFPSVHSLVIKDNDGGNGITKKINENMISVFPNPGNGILNIKTDLHIISASLIDMQGREVAATNTTVLNLRSISKGIYLLKVETGEGVITTKVVVE